LPADVAGLGVRRGGVLWKVEKRQSNEEEEDEKIYATFRVNLQ